ncbi:MAG: hypothetical protein NTY35_17350 [Planctomycetota bacterium]|nr:hypothetical protein [Planctomycetota bacterium]
MKKHARLAIVGIVVVAFLLFLLVGAFALRWIGAKQRADELLTLSAAAQPVLPSDLGRIEDPRPEPTPWFAQLVAARTRWEPSALADPSAFDALRAQSKRGQLGAETEEAFAKLEACARADCAPAVQRVLDVLAARDGIVEAPPCGLEAVRLLALGTAPQVEVARLAGQYGPVDTRVVVASLERSGAAFPTLPVAQSLALSDALQIELLRALWSERPEIVPDLLRAQRDVARIFQGAQLLVGGLATILADQRLLGMLEMSLSRLPRDTDLGWLEKDLETLRPRARLAIAAAGECAFGNRAYERLRAGAERFGPPAVLPTSLTVSYDQAHHIRAWRERIERMNQPAYRRPKSEPRGWLDEHLAPISTGLSSAPDSAVAAADQLEARLVLARAALVAFRSDAKELLEFLAKTSDPFDGKPIRAGFGEGGLVLLWSVGPDGIDDGGLDDQRDLVWRFRPR